MPCEKVCITKAFCLSASWSWGGWHWGRRGEKPRLPSLYVCPAFPGLYSHIWTPPQLLTQAGFIHSCLATKLCLTLLLPLGHTCRAGEAEDTGSIRGSGRSPGGGNGNPVQYSWATVYGVTNSWTSEGLGRDCSPPGSSVHGIPQARILEWVAIASSRGSFWPRDQTCVSCTGRWILHHCASREAISILPLRLYQEVPVALQRDWIWGRGWRVVGSGREGHGEA